MIVRRQGFTLIEIVIALTLTGIIGAGTVRLILHHADLSARINETLVMRENLRDAVAILAADIRSTAAVDGFPFASDTSLELYTVIGASSLCNAPAGPVISLPPQEVEDGQAFTSLRSTPDSNDIAFLYYGASELSPAGGWLPFRIGSVSEASAAVICPGLGGLVKPADFGREGLLVELQSEVPVAVRQGAPVRFLRRARYSIYKASDGRWYLGYKRCSPATGICNTIQPVSGPYMEGSVPPLVFRYYSSYGTPLLAEGPLGGVAAVEIAVMARSSRAGYRSLLADSIKTLVYLRNHL